MKKTRRKQSCFRCRALYVGLEDAVCKLGYEIIQSYFGDEQGFYAPADKGNPCPKPLTISNLKYELANERVNPAQQSLWGG
ncbi:MAG: hypothetical protein LLG40_15610 [Deltaproteobacteria bacterium]|nr:hypothetical protein [Deltaproteobacteria bacterium]